MNLKSRLDRLTRAATGPQGTCPHLPPVVVTKDSEDGGEVFERDAATDTRQCWCGRERLRIRIVYTEHGPGADSSNEPDESGTIRLRWPEEADEAAAT